MLVQFMPVREHAIIRENTGADSVLNQKNISGNLTFLLSYIRENYPILHSNF
jgi:hypothetical protein